MNRFPWLILPTLLSTAGGPAPLPSVPVIDGQLRGDGPWPDAISSTPVVFLPQTPVAVLADGTFKLPLPAALAPDGTNYGSPLCEGEVHQSDLRAAFATLPHDWLRTWTQGRPTGSATTRQASGGTVWNDLYVYSTFATSVRGTQNCEGVQESFDLDYERGWNLVEWTQVNGRQLSYRSIPNQRLAWHLKN